MRTLAAPTPVQARPLGRGSAVRILGTAALVVVGSLVLGALTAWGQGWIQGSASLLVNSAGPWVLIAFGFALATRTWFGGVLAGVTSLALLELGYVAHSQAGGYASAPSTVAFWLIAAALAGPGVGLAGYWVRHADGLRAALGTGLIAGVLAGEAVRIRADLVVSPWYPRGELALAVALLLGLARWRFPRPVPLALAVVSAVPVAVAVMAFLRIA